jgi:hypothetical protein
MIIGVAGAICSGKHSFSRRLAEAFVCGAVTLSGIVEDDVLKSGLAPRRSNLQKRANDNRDKFGADYYVKMALNLAQRSTSQSKGAPLILCGIYTQGEVDEIIRRGGYMVHVSCDGPDGNSQKSLEVRFGRLLDRAEAECRVSDMLTFEKFRGADSFEDAGESASRQAVAKLNASDVLRIDNSGEIDELDRQVQWLGEHLQLDARVDGRPSAFLNTRGFSPAHDRYDSLLLLEQRRAVVDILQRRLCKLDLSSEERSLVALGRGGHAVHHLTNQFALQLAEAFVNTDIEKAFESFRQLLSRTLDEEMALLTNRREFEAIHDEIHSTLRGNRVALHDAVASNVETILSNDRAQFSSSAPRPLHAMLKSGVRVRVLKDGKELIRRAQDEAGSGQIPVTEVLKRQRVVDVNDFGETKVSQIVHDAIDHVWLAKLLHDRDIYERYRSFFVSIGDPVHTDLFKREGETIASIGFGVRYWAGMAVGFVPRFGIGDILRCLDRHFDAGRLHGPHLDAFRIVRDLCRDPSQREAQSLSFVLSNYITELDEQRRKHGEIKQRIPAAPHELQVLDPWSPDFLCMLIETHRALLDSKNKHRDHLFAVHLLLEDFLSSDRPLDDEGLLICVDSLLDTDLSRVRLPGARIEWMSRHHGFTAFNDRLT